MVILQRQRIIISPKLQDYSEACVIEISRNFELDMPCRKDYTHSMATERTIAAGLNVTFSYAVGAWLEYLRERTEGRKVFQSQINRAALALRAIFNAYPELPKARMHTLNREEWTKRILGTATTPAKRIFYARVLRYFFQYAKMKGWDEET